MASTSDNKHKESCYLEKYSGDEKKYECQLCKRLVSSRRSVLKHLFQQHGLSPVKRCRKLYSYDESHAVPRSTWLRWKSNRSKKSLEFMEIRDQSTAVLSPLSTDNEANVYEANSDTGNNSDIDTDISIESGSSIETSSESISSSSMMTSSTDSMASNASDFENASVKTKNGALMLLSCFKKHNLTSSACVDILKTVRLVLPDARNNPLLHYNKVLSYTPSSSYIEIHYCNKCEYIFPKDGHIHQCETQNCGGMVKNFMLADVKEVLKSLLKSPGILEDIKKNMSTISESVNSDVIKDIFDGELYREQNLNTEHTDSEHEVIKLTAVLNTDGVNLYSSSRIELWPVFLCINELSPALRFSRENILLIGLWQGKGKPPFKAFFKSIREEINLLSTDGFDLDEQVHVTLSVIGVTADLPAKAALLNMTLYNGAEACITCEEPGRTVTQGHGHSRCYPYRPSRSRFPIRSSENILQLMNAATERNRQKGFKGVSGLAHLSNFDLVYGILPDYMHCVLLGIVKTLMCKWFSAKESGKDYFVGKDLKQISDRFVKIKPPYFIERLPRNLEKHYLHFKATELQAFLLFYAVPCLHGILPTRFLEHFALLSEAIHILLRENITQVCIERSEFLLEKFYSQFSGYYGEGSCGLNVHNACVHMPTYVRKLGPLWAWSCFAFEDANSMILQSVHGTGDVVKQALKKQEVSMYIRSSDKVSKANKTKLKVTFKAQNCEILGALHQIGRITPTCITESLGVQNAENLKKVQRVVVNGERFYSHDYSRMKRINCHAVLYSGDKFGLIQYFVLIQPSNRVYAVLQKADYNVDSWLCTYEAAKHLNPVVLTNLSTVVPVEDINTTLVIIKMENEQDAIVAKMPNRLGHAVLK